MIVTVCIHEGSDFPDTYKKLSSSKHGIVKSKLIGYLLIKHNKNILSVSNIIGYLSVRRALKISKSKVKDGSNITI